MMHIFDTIGLRPSQVNYFFKEQNVGVVWLDPQVQTAKNNQYYPGYALLNRIIRHIYKTHESDLSKCTSKFTKRFFLIATAVPAFLISLVEAITKCAMAIFPCSIFTIAGIPASQNLFRSAKYSLTETATLLKNTWNKPQIIYVFKNN